LLNKPFEFALVGAGAISAGAYTAGVVDFIIQALDSWYAAKEGKEAGTPPHEVKLSAFSGASAGAITAALTAGFLASDQPPLRSKAEADRNAGRNKLFDAWVDKIDIEHLLQARDLEETSRVVSLLDSTVLREIADAGLTILPRETKRPYLADDFHVMLTVTNLRGVPYEIALEGAQHKPHIMHLHADYVHFCFGDGESERGADVTSLSWKRLGEDGPGIELLKNAALASGAFPIGLMPRTLSLLLQDPGRVDFYSSRRWSVPLTGSDGRCEVAEEIPVSWRHLEQNYHYDFLCVDGGVMNNEPLELARQILAGSGGRNARDGDKAEKAVVMIDPFPSDPTFATDYDGAPPALVQQILSLFNALKNQARFKPDELKLAAHPRNYSRFLIAPSRNDEEFPIASGALGGFGGFLKRNFREHDFFLGRRNAQKFLSDHFVLLETNPLFVDWSEEMRQQFCVRDADTKEPIIRDTQRLLPIIPLIGSARLPCEALPWPRYASEDMTRLESQLEKRLGVVLDNLVSQYFATNNLLWRLAAKFVVGRKRKELLQYACDRVNSDLRRMNLLDK
jgi:predicted acylesterase/phospholipase RssA